MKKMSKKKKIILSILGSFITLIIFIIFLLYGPINYFRELLITTAMSTMNHQYLATFFYDDETINKVLKKHKVIESGEISNPDLIEIKKYDDLDEYDDEIERQILEKDKDNDLYKLIKIKEKTYSGYLVVIYDPTRIKVVTSSKLNEDGELPTTIATNNNALITINGAGFKDLNWDSNGAIPLGVVIQNGKLTFDGGSPDVGGGIFGFTSEGKLILGKMNYTKALELGIKEGLEYGPFLIMDGKKSKIEGNGGSGLAPRTAIGQRQDGIVLFLVIEGRQLNSFGASIKDLVEIMYKYKAFNAVNLDGGSSSTLIIENKLINNPTAKSSDGQRKIPTAIIVK